MESLILGRCVTFWGELCGISRYNYKRADMHRFSLFIYGRCTLFCTIQWSSGVLWCPHMIKHLKRQWYNYNINYDSMGVPCIYVALWQLMNSFFYNINIISPIANLFNMSKAFITYIFFMSVGHHHGLTGSSAGSWSSCSTRVQILA